MKEAQTQRLIKKAIKHASWIVPYVGTSKIRVKLTDDNYMQNGKVCAAWVVYSDPDQEHTIYFDRPWWRSQDWSQKRYWDEVLKTMVHEFVHIAQRDLILSLAAQGIQENETSLIAERWAYSVERAMEYFQKQNRKIYKKI